MLHTNYSSLPPYPYLSLSPPPSFSLSHLHTQPVVFVLFTAFCCLFLFVVFSLYSHFHLTLILSLPFFPQEPILL